MFLHRPPFVIGATCRASRSRDFIVFCDAAIVRITSKTAQHFPSRNFPHQKVVVVEKVEIN
jgi:hypothetical protein